ncbi:serine hydrolase domain-containing protein [Streptomyces leeuwenhoekii]|uniref:Penicillin-binding protein 4 n=1 Tax=Streptomyces leeuwenhoekii TaxID=1437453 RepID=A0A0F7VRJ4_STRLW|nr:serine hydrolase domain-containing protein [Streptomyces leeuwenhoekii]CQR60122.1 Penicillin-binding protein 4 [Streptomyces leeuwenhoekii]
MPYPTAAPVAERLPSPDRRTLQNRLDELARAHGVPGAQLAVHTGTQVISVHTGTADAATGRPFTADTAVPLGSVTKLYTAAAVLLLADDGDLDLDEPAAAILPELRALPEVTIRHLLSHTAGLPSGPDSDTAAGLTTARYLASACAPRDVLFAPGTGFSYSNAGYTAAGRLIEEVTGMTWREAIQALLLDPLGTRPAFLGGPAPDRPVAAGHARNTASGRLLSVAQNLAPAEAPAGALLAGALDLLALGRALVGRSTALPPSAAEPMRRPEPAARPGALADAWGPGPALFRREDRWWCGHDGNAHGTSCHLRAEPGTGVVVAFTGNSSSATALWRDLTDDLDALTGLAVPTTPAPAPDRGHPIALPECAGTYRNGTTEYRVSLDAAGSPVLSIDGDLPLPLVCYADLSCDLVDPATGRRESAGHFHRDPLTGVLDRVQISGRAARRTADAGTGTSAPDTSGSRAPGPASPATGGTVPFSRRPDGPACAPASPPRSARTA